MYHSNEEKLRALKGLKNSTLEKAAKINTDKNDPDMRNPYGDGPKTDRKPVSALKRGRQPWQQKINEGPKEKDPDKEEDEEKRKSDGVLKKEPNKLSKLIKKAYGEKEFSEESVYEAFPLFDKRTKYYSDYTDKRDVMRSDLETIMAAAKENVDPILDKYAKTGPWGVVTDDISWHSQVKWRDALEKVIWSMKSGKYQSKIDYNDYETMLVTLVKEDTGRDIVAKDKDTPQSKFRAEVDAVRAKLYDEMNIRDSNAAWVALEKLRVSPKIQSVIMRDYYQKDIYYDVKGKLDEVWPDLPENIKTAFQLLTTISSLKKEVTEKKIKVAAKKKFNPKTSLKKLFQKKKNMSRDDLSYHLKTNYSIEEEEIDEIITGAVGNGELARVSPDSFAFKGGYKGPVKTLEKKENTILSQRDKLKEAINSLEDQIKGKEEALKVLDEQWENLRDDIDLKRLEHSDVPEFTKKVFEAEIYDHIKSLTSGDLDYSYSLDFEQVNDDYKPAFSLTLFSEKGIDFDSLKKAARIFQQRLERLLNGKFGYVDYNISGNGVVQKDIENDRAFTNVTLTFDLELIDPKQIDLIKDEIEILIHWLNDHFVN